MHARPDALTRAARSARSPGINKYAHPFGLGVYHTGVEVYGTGTDLDRRALPLALRATRFARSPGYEWAFGGHDIAGQPGIYALRASSLPRTPGERIGTDEQHYVYRASYPIGSTRLSKEEVEDVVRDMGKSASGPLYATGGAFHLGAPQTCIS